jgi:hypothetical protein
MEVSGQIHAPATLPPGKEALVLIGMEVERASEPVWTGIERKIPILHRDSNPDHPIVQPVVSRYTD